MARALVTLLPVLLLLLLVLLSLAAAADGANCTNDDACPSDRPHCEAAQCVRLAGLGEYCAAHSDCASYASLGDAACTASCNVEARCGPVAGPTPRCCAGFPSGALCSPSREKLTDLVQCAAGLQCLPAANDEHRCAPKASTRWAVGVAISVVGAIVLNLGLQLQKFAFRKLEAMPEAIRPEAWRSPVWVIGFVIWLIGNLANFVALSFAAQSLIASLGAVSLVANAVAAPLINHEPFGWPDLVSILFITAGTVIVVVFANHDETSYRLCALVAFYSRASVIIYLTLMLALIFGLWFFINVIEANKKRIAASRRASLILASPGAGSPMSPTIRKLGWFARLRRRIRYFIRDLFRFRSFVVRDNSITIRIMLPFAYASIGGILGGLTVLFAKSAAELVTTTIDGNNQFVYFFTYVILIGIIVTSIGQIYYINAGLRNYDALLQVPSFYVVYTICGIVSGGIYFDEFQSYSGVQFALFVLGVVLTFVGVGFLAGRLKSTGGPEDHEVALDLSPTSPTVAAMTSATTQLDMAPTALDLSKGRSGEHPKGLGAGVPGSVLAAAAAGGTTPTTSSEIRKRAIPAPAARTMTYDPPTAADDDATPVSGRQSRAPPSVLPRSGTPSDDDADAANLPGSVPESPVRGGSGSPQRAGSRPPSGRSPPRSAASSAASRHDSSAAMISSNKRA